MSLPALFLTAALLYAAWLRLGWHRMAPDDVPGLRRTAGGLSVLCMLLGLYTLSEYPSWDHLPLPFSMIGWAAFLPLALTAGLVQLARERQGSGWALLGLPVSALVTALTGAAFG